MTIRRTRNPVGTELTPENIQGIGGTDLTREGEISTDSSDSELKVRLNAATRTVVTEDQTQVLTNKTIDADLNTISDLEVDNLKSGVLNVSTTLSGASDTQLPSALAVKTYIDDKAAAQNEASEISVVPAGTIVATNVQAAIEELDGDIQGHINDTVDAHDASAISNSPSGNLAATDVQGALNELQSNIDTNYTAFTDHVSDAVDAHDASAISVTPTGNLAADDVQEALVELQTDIDNFSSSAGTLTNKNLDDSTVSFVDTSDATKKISFDAAGSTGTKTTITSSQTANRVITLPDATTDMVGHNNTQLLANKSFNDNSNFFVDEIDSSKKIGFSATGSTATTTTIASSQTANRTVTLPDATDTLVGKATTDTLTNKTIDADLNTITNIENADIKTGAAIARSKLASGTNNALVANNGSGVLSDVSGISVSAFGLSVSPSKNFSLELADDSTTTGGDASVAAFTGSALTFSNGSLASIANIPAGSNGQELIIVNRTGNSFLVKDESGAIGTASARIFTGTGADITFAVDAALLLTYDATAARWQVIGGSGSGGGGSSTLSGLADVTIVTPLENQVLTYDSGTSTWINQDNSLQQVYDNSATTEITTNSTNGAVDLKRGSASDSDDVLRILNNAGVVVAQTNALGQHNTMYSSPENMLKNGSLELPSIADWTCTVGTCTRTTTSGEFSHGTAALKVALSAQAMNVSQTVTTPSGIQKQGYVRVIYRVPATMADFQVCTLVDAAEQTCVPTANLIKDDTFRSIEIPLTFGTTSAGIKFKTTSAYTANAYFDGAILAQGLGFQNLQGDTVYSAKSTSGGTISDENKDWINGNASITSANYTITFNTGIFTVAPNCWATVNNTPGSQRIIAASSVSATQVVFSTFNAASAAGLDFMFSCQKSGNDYLASSANVYSQANQNVSALYTGAPPTGTLAASFNTVTFGTKVKDTHNAYSSGTYTIPVSASYDISTAVAANGTYNGAQQLQCAVFIDGTQKYSNSNAPTTAIGRAWVNLSVKAVSLTAGQLVTIRCYNDGTGLSYESNATTNYFSIARSDSNVIVGRFDDMIPRIAYLSDVKASGTAGGASVAGFQTRTLNTIVDTYGIVTSLSSNQFTLPAGTYSIEASAPSFRTSAHKTRIRNITDTTTALLGTSEISDAAGFNVTTTSTVSGEITITSSKVFELQHYTQNVRSGDGLGTNVSSGESEVFSTVKIQRIK